MENPVEDENKKKCQLLDDFFNIYYYKSPYYYWSDSPCRGQKYNQNHVNSFAQENNITVSLFKIFLSMFHEPEQIRDDIRFPPYTFEYEQQIMPEQGRLPLPVYINLLHRIAAQEEKELRFSMQEDDGGYVPVIEKYSYHKAREAALKELERLGSPAFDLMNYLEMFEK